MHVFEAIVIIAVVAIIASVFKSAINGKGKKNRGDQVEDPNAVRELQAEVATLKERVATLETIVTDKSYNLKREIDDL